MATTPDLIPDPEIADYRRPESQARGVASDFASRNHPTAGIFRYRVLRSPLGFS